MLEFFSLNIEIKQNIGVSGFKIRANSAQLIERQI